MREVFRIVTQMRSEGISVLLVEQNVRMSLEIAGHAFILDSGAIGYNGIIKAIAADEERVLALAGASTEEWCPPDSTPRYHTEYVRSESGGRKSRAPSPSRARVAAEKSVLPKYWSSGRANSSGKFKLIRGRGKNSARRHGEPETALLRAPRAASTR